MVERSHPDEVVYSSKRGAIHTSFPSPSTILIETFDHVERPALAPCLADIAERIVGRTGEIAIFIDHGRLTGFGRGVMKLSVRWGRMPRTVALRYHLMMPELSVLSKAALRLALMRVDGHRLYCSAPMFQAALAQDCSR